MILISSYICTTTCGIIIILETHAFCKLLGSKRWGIICPLLLGVGINIFMMMTGRVGPRSTIIIFTIVHAVWMWKKIALSVWGHFDLFFTLSASDVKHTWILKLPKPLCIPFSVYTILKMRSRNFNLLSIRTVLGRHYSAYHIEWPVSKNE